MIFNRAIFYRRIYSTDCDNAYLMTGLFSVDQISWPNESRRRHDAFSIDHFYENISTILFKLHSTFSLHLYAEADG